MAAAAARHPICDDDAVTVRTRVSGPADRTAILALLAAARGDELSEAERAERGFVQGRMDAALLARFQEGTGVFVAEEDGVLAGFAMTSEPGTVTAGPPGRTADLARQHLGASVSLFLYGPAAVDGRFQGRGILSRLLGELSRALGDRFDRGVAFVETANAKSLAVHRHYGMTELARFVYDGRDYVVLAFAPADFAAR
jgi:L-amino acid N-acyltransferase YncA